MKLPERFKIAVCQMMVSVEKDKNIEKALDMIDTSAKNGAQIAVLPEMFNCPYDIMKFRKYAEAQDGDTVKAISAKAKELGIYVVAGSIPEIDESGIYNTCFIFDKGGVIIGKHRKMHLFDVDIPGKLKVMESIMITPGNEITVVDTEYCRIGVAICYDIRFPEMFRLMVLEGAKLVIVPGAFNMVTGPAHWERLIGVRAIDNQVYLAAAAPARDENSKYVCYGNSMIVDPWGDIKVRADEKEGIIYSDIDLEKVESIRCELHLLTHMRRDVYQIVENNLSKNGNGK